MTAKWIKIERQIDDEVSLGDAGKEIIFLKADDITTIRKEEKYVLVETEEENFEDVINYDEIVAQLKAHGLVI